MSDWPRARLGDLAQWFSGGTPRTSEPSYWGGDIPWISAASLKEFFISTSDRNVTADGAASGTRLVPPRSIIFVVRGMSLMSEFRLGITMREVAFGQDCKALIANRGVDPYFLAYAIKAQTARILDLVDAAGHGTGRLQTDRIADLRIAIPADLREQKRYSSLIKAFDDKIAANDRIADSSRALALSHLRSAVEFGGAVELQIGPVATSLNRGIAPRYTDDPLQLCVLNQKCIRDGRVSFGPARRTLVDNVPSQKLLEQHDVLVNSTGVGTLGRVARWTERIPSTVDSHVTVVRFDPAKVDPVCAGLAMLSVEHEIEALGEGSTGQTELSRARLSTFELTVPTRDRAERLRPILDALEDRGHQALEESLSLAELRDTLLPKLMSCEIRVRDAGKIVEDVT
jgi:type I restriction enzyme S subunit